MKNIGTKLFCTIILGALASCSQVAPPKPIGPVPSERQLAWHDLEYYAFVHFNMNTFTDMEWGLGGESPQQFDPTELDVRQWARVAKDAGMKGIIITAKHHDGFCLWPTKTTEHSVKNSPWKDGKGDLLKDLSEACAEFGLKFGVYLSPWDRNNAHYGTPEYVEIFHEQLRELLTGYGPIFEVWFDGANGGSGYYGGANETRKIDNKSYYEWDKTNGIVRELQPNAVIFSDGGPDVRWVGNEEGWADETNWSIMRRDEIYPGWPRYIELRSGHENGTHWLPAEADVSIRPGWYYHPDEDHQVRSLQSLLDIYYNSVGRNANLLLNLPVDTRGLVHDKDVEQLMALRQQIDKDFAVELVYGTKVVASNERGKSPDFRAENVNDADSGSYWATDDGVHQGILTFEFQSPIKINRILLQEYIPLGQRVKRFVVEAEVDGKWQELDGQTTIGYKRILRFGTVEATKIRINFLDAKGPLAISNVEMYHAPNLLTEPEIKRDRKGTVSLLVPDKNVEIYYTLDGSEPTVSSTKYTGGFLVKEPAMVRAISYDPVENKGSAVVGKHIDLAKGDWKVKDVTSGDFLQADKMIDEDPRTFWATEKDVKGPHEVVIDLGADYTMTGFTFWPMQERFPFGIITDYEFSVSSDGHAWKMVAKGEFGNVANNRIEQVIRFAQTRGRYIKLKSVRVNGSDVRASIAEIGVLTSGK